MSSIKCRGSLKRSSPNARSAIPTGSDHVAWNAQLGPVLNTDSPDALRDAIKRAYVEVLDKISERTPGRFTGRRR
jgi:hypothetical protein